MPDPLTKEQVEKAKGTQKGIIAECDKALADLQSNIGVLQALGTQQKVNKKAAKDVLAALEKDFPSGVV